MANDRTIPTAASAATVSGRAPRSAKVGESGRTGARAANSAAVVLSSVGSNVECVTMWGVPAVIGSAPKFGGCAHVFFGAGHARRQSRKRVSRAYTRGAEGCDIASAGFGANDTSTPADR